MNNSLVSCHLETRYEDENMKFGITYDADGEAGLDDVIFGANNAFEKYFSDRFYSEMYKQIQKRIRQTPDRMLYSHLDITYTYYL